MMNKPYLHKFERHLLNASTLRSEISGHFLQEEEPEAMADAIADLIWNVNG